MEKSFGGDLSFDQLQCEAIAVICVIRYQSGCWRVKRRELESFALLPSGEEFWGDLSFDQTTIGFNICVLHIILVGEGSRDES